MQCSCPSKMGTTLRVLPKLYKKLVVKKITPVFKEAVSTVVEPLVKPQDHEVLIRNRYVGINASDVNMAAGRYFSDGVSPPFGLGFEGLGEVADCGNGVSDLKPGQGVMYMSNNSFSEYVYLPEEDVIPIPLVKPDFIPLMVSGTTSALSLDKSGNISPGEKVLVTAAAGGTGHIAVQWAKHHGCHVIGTCSSKEKCDFLKSIGCDRPINYKAESLEDVLKTEYPNGIDVMWETIGGKMTELLLNHLAVKGRLIIVGAIANYQQKVASHVMASNLTYKLLLNSSSITGFFLPHYKADIPHYMSILVALVHEEKLKAQVDTGASTNAGIFQGIDDIPRAVEYLYGGKNKGKVVVTL